jgi:hypothetical protein
MKSRIISLTITILFITLAHSRVLTKQNGTKDSESSVSLSNNSQTRAQHNKIINEAMKSHLSHDEESMSNKSQQVVVIKQAIKSTKTPSEVSRDDSSPSQKQVVVQVVKSNKTSFQTDPSMRSDQKVHVVVAKNSVKSSHKNESDRSVVPQVVVVTHNETQNLSQETSSFKTDPSMKDYDINQKSHVSETHVIEKTVDKSETSSSHNSDIIEDVVVNKGTQVLSERSSDLDNTSQTVSETRDVSEGLKITSAFVGVVTLIAML